MKVEITPGQIFGSITPPPSKSVLHRLVISSCLAKGYSRIENVTYSNDILATINAFASLGVNITKHSDYIEIESDGIADLSQEFDVDCGESGSTIRFLIPILSNDKKGIFRGKSSLIQRPMSVYEKIFSKNNLDFVVDNDFIMTKGRLTPGNYIVQGDISSQFISGLLFILPVLDGDSTIEITGDFESSEYVNITVDVLSRFGIIIEKIQNRFIISGNQKYRPAISKAEADFSQLAFFAVLGTINNDLKITGVNFNSLQPDKRILDIIKSMGGNLQYQNTELSVVRTQTSGIKIDVSQCPDLAPILGVLAACSNGESEIVNAKRLIIKESNRLLTTHETLKRFGVETEMFEDSLTIKHCERFNGGVFDSYNDHRIAMMISIAATIASEKVIITNAEAVNKSYPDFYKDLQSLGVEIKYI